MMPRPVLPAFVIHALLFLSPAACPAAEAAGDDEALAKGLAEANELLGAGQSAKALEVLEPLAASHPKSAAVHFAMGQAYIREKDFAKARTHLEKTVELDKENSTARLLLAAIYRKDKKPRDAARLAGEVLKRDRENIAAMKVLAEIEMDAKRFEKAAEWYGKALNVRPDDAELAALVATAWTESVKALREGGGSKKKLDEAGEKALAALDLVGKDQPDLDEVLYNRGTVQILLERWDDAVKSLEEFLEKKKDDGRGVFNLAMALEGGGRTKESIDAWKRFIAIAEKGKDAMLKRDIPRAKEKIKALEKELKSPKKKKKRKESDEAPAKKEGSAPKLGL